MNIKEIVSTMVAVALGVVLAGFISAALTKMQSKSAFENE